MIKLLLVGASYGADVTLDGEIREVGRMISDFPIDAAGTQLGTGAVLEQRIRLGGGLDWERLSVGLAGDVLTGPIAGSDWGIAPPEDPLAVDQRHYGAVEPFSIDRFALRQASVSGQAGPVQMEVGVVTSHWGLGMVANDGNHERLFGQTRFGDRVFRVRATTRLPDVPLFFSGAVDRVIEDELAQWSEDQVASQTLISILYAEEAGLRLGAYGVRRSQQEADELRSTNATVLDLYADVPFAGLGLSWRAAAEVAGITGTTNRALSYGALDQLNVRALGATGLLEVTDDVVGVVLRGGYASGDANLDDDTTHDFTFDRDFEVGSVLFPEVTGAINAGAYALLDDPQYSAEPPEGAEGLVTEGAFQRAAFASPVITLKPRDWLEARAGAVMAWGTAPIAQPFYTVRAGGTPTSHHDLATESPLLGTEACWAVAVSSPLRKSVPESLSGGLTKEPDDSLVGSLEIQGGHAFLSDDLAGEGPDQVDLYTLTGRLRW